MNDFYDLSQQENGNIAEINKFISLLKGIVEDCQYIR